MGDLPIRHGDGVLHNIAHVAKAGAQDHGHLGGKGADLAADVVGALLILRKGIVHKESSLTADKHEWFRSY